MTKGKRYRYLDYLEPGIPIEDSLTEADDFNYSVNLSLTPQDTDTATSAEERSTVFARP